jgi:hypothetical protein
MALLNSLSVGTSMHELTCAREEEGGIISVVFRAAKRRCAKRVGRLVFSAAAPSIDDGT